MGREAVLRQLDHKLVVMLRESFQAQGALRAWNAQLSKLGHGEAEIRLPYSEQVTQQHGYFHGGVIGAVADVAGGYAANTVLMPHKECLTAEYKINIVAPGTGEYLVARGKVLKAGKTLVVAGAEVFTGQHGKEKLCAVMQQTLFVIDKQTAVHETAGE